jgi:hypothetical protein
MFIILQGGFKTKTQYRLGKKLYTEGNRRWLLGGFGDIENKAGQPLQVASQSSNLRKRFILSLVLF